MTGHVHKDFNFKAPLALLDERIFDLVANVLDAPTESEKPALIKSINQLRGQTSPERGIPYEMIPLHVDNLPTLVATINGKKKATFLWGIKDNQGNIDPSKTMAIVYKEVKDLFGRHLSLLPENIILGSKFQGWLEYNVSCCSNKEAFNGLSIIRDGNKVEAATINAIGIKRDIVDYFKGRVLEDPEDKILKDLVAQAKPQSGVRAKPSPTI